MKTVYSERHALHDPRQNPAETGMVEYFEKPSRAETILRFINERRIGPVLPPQPFGLDVARRVHSPRYLDFLENAYPRWVKAGFRQDVCYPAVSAIQNPGAREPRTILGQLGLHAADCCIAFTATSWQAIESSCHTALTAQKIVSSGEAAAFALCRPPGHHANASTAAGYCYINNAAVAAQAFLDQGAKRVAILDVDYHHGNGTQDIFYDRADVMLVSIHADPADDYPYFFGYADEAGRGAGEGFNANYPLPLGSDYRAWAEALDHGLARIRAYGPDALIVSLGVDTFEADPISQFRLKSPDYVDIGARIAQLRRPTLFVMEGGYAVDAIGINVTNMLAGFES